MVQPCYVPVYPGAAFLRFQQSVDGRCEHGAGVDDDLEVAELSLLHNGLLVQVSQDVDPGHGLPAAAAAAPAGQSVGGGGRQRHGVGEHVIFKHVAPVSSIFLLQQRQQLQPAGNRTIIKKKTKQKKTGSNYGTSRLHSGAAFQQLINASCCTRTHQQEVESPHQDLSEEHHV